MSIRYFLTANGQFLKLDDHLFTLAIFKQDHWVLIPTKASDIMKAKYFGLMQFLPSELQLAKIKSFVFNDNIGPKDIESDYIKAKSGETVKLMEVDFSQENAVDVTIKEILANKKELCQYIQKLNKPLPQNTYYQQRMELSRRLLEKVVKLEEQFGTPMLANKKRRKLEQWAYSEKKHMTVAELLVFAKAERDRLNHWYKKEGTAKAVTIDAAVKDIESDPVWQDERCQRSAVIAVQPSLIDALKKKRYSFFPAEADSLSEQRLEEKLPTVSCII